MIFFLKFKYVCLKGNILSKLNLITKRLEFSNTLCDYPAWSWVVAAAIT